MSVPLMTNHQERFVEFPTADGWLVGDGKATTEASKAAIVAILERL